MHWAPVVGGETTVHWAGGSSDHVTIVILQLILCDQCQCSARPDTSGHIVLWLGYKIRDESYILAQILDNLAILELFKNLSLVPWEVCSL